MKRSSKKRTRKINKMIYKKTNKRKSKSINTNIGVRWIA